jgi:ribosomal protein L12E/L44/L45/RPP1/RPP2
MNEKDQFIADLYPAATKVSQETGMSRELILAQAAQETGWGEKVLPGTNNIFNIKASPDWHGPTKTFTVPEFEHGKKVMVNAEFRVYGSIEEALQDRVKFLQENPRYAKAGLFDEGTKGNLEKEAAALQKAGYATDPKYAEQLVAVYNGQTMQRAIKHAQEKAAAPDHASTVPAGQIHTTAHTHPHANIFAQDSQGTTVQKLQTELSELGYKDAKGHPLKADGVFGIDTRHAVETFQADHHLAMDGKVGPVTEKALNASLKEHAKEVVKAPDLAHPKNPDHKLYEQALAGVMKIDAEMGRTPDQYSANLAASLVVAAKANGLTHIDTVKLSEDGSHTFAAQNTSPLKMIAEVSTAQAVSTSIEQSSIAAQTVQPIPAAHISHPLSPHPQQAPQPIGPTL